MRVGHLPGQRALGRLIAGGIVVPCALGPSGIVRNKREGDGATPAGVFRFREAFARTDRVVRPVTHLTVRSLARQDGWCDDVRHALYNQEVRKPFAGSHELLWRDDHLYDLVVVIDYNVGHPCKGRGSAIFLHVAAPGLTPTAGCVAIPRPALARLMSRLGPRTRIFIG